MKRKCIVCGKEFQPKRRTQKYCSPECRRYANRHGTGCHHSDSPAGAAVIREFTCVHCGKKVRVTDPADCRMKFCSLRCERYYWKHPKTASAQMVSREFTCKECGTRVKVTTAMDRRRSFCSPACSQRWFNRNRGQRAHRRN